MKFQEVTSGVCAAKGFLASGVHCGLRKSKQRPDLALIYSETMCNAASVYTQNKVKGAPIFVTKKNLENGKAQAIIVNSGNANTCNLDGEEKAEKMCQLIGAQMELSPEDVIVASTGIIGEILPIHLIADHVGELKKQLSCDGNPNAANAILTTDLVEKVYGVSFELNGKTCTLGGIAKGSGMIHPNMATMLCFLTTDVSISTAMLQKALSHVVDDTFNMISVDGDTSTNDMVSVLASGLAENEEIVSESSPEYKVFEEALFEVMKVLSKKIAQDGEGATKLLEVQVHKAKDITQAKAVAKSVVTSSLFKSAIFGKDPNWGRILCAVGYTEGDFDINQVAVSLQSVVGQVQVCEKGRGLSFDGQKASAVLGADVVEIVITMNTGTETATAWGCDLTYDYVKINADYHT
ncbi:MAG: bifunctional glutamate N-acetyltransferase/amino-acid acetyltransferase ArgJ [Eubacteriales bacterium]